MAASPSPSSSERLEWKTSASARHTDAGRHHRVRAWLKALDAATNADIVALLASHCTAVEDQSVDVMLTTALNKATFGPMVPTTAQGRQSDSPICMQRVLEASVYMRRRDVAVQLVTPSSRSTWPRGRLAARLTRRSVGRLPLRCRCPMRC
jgi:site-specific recombinase